MDIQRRLDVLGLVLPAAPKPIASYTPYVRIGLQIYISGQLPIQNGSLIHKGRLGAEITIEQGKAAARCCAVNILSQMHAACDGDLDRVERIIRLTGFVSCEAGFTDQPAVINGASDLFADVFGEAGIHARAAVGVSALPMGAPVEIDAIAHLRL